MYFFRTNFEERELIVDLLVRCGFTLDFKDYIVKELPFPLGIDFKNKIVGCMTTPTQAALICNSDKLISISEVCKKLKELDN